jgi:hypothetical protein
MAAGLTGHPLADAGLVLAIVVVVLWGARRLIIAAAAPDDPVGPARRPGASALPPPRVCPAADCATPNRPDASFCRRCGTKLD